MRRKFLIIEAYGNIYYIRKSSINVINVINQIKIEVQIITNDDNTYVFEFERIEELESCFNSIKKQIR